MKVLVTGGTGVIGHGVVKVLVERGHSVRLLSRQADKDERASGDRVEAWKGDVSDSTSVRGSAAGCDAVLHIAGIAVEQPPEGTFDRVNVQGTINILTEAWASGVKRLVNLSSLGAERGASDYHKSKLAAEELVKSFEGNWTIVRPGNVYGPGDEVISVLVKMVRSLPVMPMVGFGAEPFQPIWHEDLAEALVRILERDDLGNQTLEVTGTETTSMRDLVDRIREITGRGTAAIPVPATLVSAAVSVAGAVGVDLPVDDNKLTMLSERIMIDRTDDNALVSVLSITPVGIDDGLRRLLEVLPEQTEDDGVGALREKRYWADISRTAHTPESLCEEFRARCSEIMPIDFDGHDRITEGMNLTGAIPGRGQIQVRVSEATPRAVTFATVEGHPLAGAVHFLFDGRDGAVRFTVHVRVRPADAVDWVALNLGGFAMEDLNWQEVVRRMVEVSGGEGAVMMSEDGAPEM
jgi:uncharacterized protein YbjT (DUF2867 family)